MLKRAGAIVLLGGVSFAGSGCFLPNTGQLTVVVGEEFFPDGPPSFTFDKDSYSVPGGEIDVTLLAPADSPVAHNLHIDGYVNPFLDLPAEVDSAEGTLELEPGYYGLYCSIPGHEALGMTAELIVT